MTFEASTSDGETSVVKRIARVTSVILTALLATVTVATQGGSRTQAQTDYYYYEGRRVVLERAAGQAVVRLAPGQPVATDGARIRALLPSAAVGMEIRADSRSYRMVTVPRGKTLDGAEVVDTLRAASDVEFVAPVFREPTTGATLLPTDEIIVAVRPGETRADLDGLALSLGLTVDRALRGTTDEFVLRTPPGTDAVERARALYETGLVAWAEPNFLQQYHRTNVPDDPGFVDQWHLQNTGQGGGVAGADIHAVQAWDAEIGSPATVIAIIDDGVEMAHPDLAPNIFVNRGEIPDNGIDDDQNGYVDDVHGWDFYANDNDPSPVSADENHGTAVAGVAAARGANALGVTGVCQRCSILPVKIVGGGSFVASDRIAEAIRYAAGLADILNNSWGGGAANGAIAAAISFATSAAVHGGRGAVVVASAGNSAGGNVSLVARGLPAGTHRFRWVYGKDESFTQGDDAAWLAAVRFPGNELVQFTGASLPPGWTTGGSAPWRMVDDPVHADEGSCTASSARSGTISNSQSSFIEVVKTLPAGDFRSIQYVSSEADFDGLQVLIDLNNDGTYDLGTDLISGLPPTGVAYPAGNLTAIAVGASSNMDCRSHYSQFGSQLALLAPGSAGLLNLGIFTTDRIGVPGYDATDYIEDFGGTSSSSPVVAGVIGLLLSKNPTLTFTSVKQILSQSADKIGPVPYVNGRNDRYGAGRVNAAAALAATSAPPNVPPLIYAQPLDALVGFGAIARLSVRASGQSLSYQWYLGNAGDTASPVAGATGAVYDTPPVTVTSKYWVRVTNPFGTSDSRTTTLTVGAAYDAGLKVPRCLSTASPCDSGALVKGRGNVVGPEPHFPNTINDTCTDGTQSPSGLTAINRIRISTVDGGEFETGKMVQVEVWSWQMAFPSSAVLDLYFAGDAQNPTWIRFAELTPPADSTVAGYRSVGTYPLPDGTVHAVRAALSGFGFDAVTGCAFNASTIQWGETDDLVFSVKQVPFAPIIIKQPVGNSLAFNGSTVSLAVTAVGSAPLSYQWYRGAVGQTGDPVAGATTNALNVTATLTLTNYWVRVSNASGFIDSAGVPVAANLNVIANIDPALHAPVCVLGISCDTFSTVIGRGTGEISNQPNTIGGTCRDGTAGGINDESVAQVKISTVDGSLFAPGKLVRVDVRVNAYSNVSDYLDLYYTANAVLNPSWTYLTTIRPTVTGAQTLTATYTLPFGARQAVRARFRFGGSPAPCGSGGPTSYDDVDDVIITTDSPTSMLPVITSHPRSQLATEGQTALLTVDAYGAALQYQWYLGASGDTSAPITGATGSTLTTGPIQGTTDYWVRVTATGGTVDSATATLKAVTPTAAVYSASVSAPGCAAWTMWCDSGGLLAGRSALGPELHAPNTLGTTCQDGSSGIFHVDESIDRIRVYSPDGNRFVAGGIVNVDVTLWAFSYLSDFVDVYYSPTASNPVWTLVATLRPQTGGLQTLSTTYVLPTGSVQAVRAHLRYRGSPTPCGSGPFDDHDDLAFAVGGPALLDGIPTTMGEPTTIWPGTTVTSADTRTGTATPSETEAVAALSRELDRDGQPPIEMRPLADPVTPAAMTVASEMVARRSDASVISVEASPTPEFTSERTYWLAYAADRSLGVAYAEIWFLNAVPLPLRDDHTCKAYVERATNRVLLVNDAGSDLIAGAIGTRGAVANSQCSIDLASIRLAADERNLTVTMNVRFRSDYDHAVVYTQSVDARGASSGWIEQKNTAAATDATADLEAKR